MKKNTIIDGIAASEHLDSSGESLNIEGMDISSLGGADSVLNWEHNSKDKPAQVVGKVTFAKKIMKESDAKEKREKRFWNKVKKPFLYVKAELFDGVGHSGAQDIAAMLRYKNMDKGKKSRLIVGFSIEGGKMEKEGMVVTKSVARDIAITVKPCNKVCDIDIIKEEVDDDFLYKNQDFDCQILVKGEGTLSKSLKYRDLIISDIKKALPSKESFNQQADKFKDSKSFKQKQDKAKLISTMASKPAAQPQESKPKREFTQATAPDKMKVGDRINYKKPRSGRDIYNDPDTWKTENNMRKALIAGMMGGTPDSQTGSAALGKEDVDSEMHQVSKKKAKKREIKKSQPSMSFPRFDIENKPDMQVKTIDPKKTYKKPSGETVTQGDIESKKIGQKYIQGQKQQADARSLDEFDDESQKYIKDQSRSAEKVSKEGFETPGIKGFNMRERDLGVNETYDFSPSTKKQGLPEARNNYPSTKHHEGLHRTFAALSEKTSPSHTKALVSHILDNFFDKDNIQGVKDYVGLNYEKDDNYMHEEHLTHVLDLLTNKDKREDHNKHFVNGKIRDVDTKDLKSGWKKAVEFTRNLDRNKLNEINEIYNQKQKPSRKEPKIERVAPGTSGIKG